MSKKEFTDKVFDAFAKGDKEEAKRIIKETLNEAINYDLNNDEDLENAISYALNSIDISTADDIEKLAKDVFSKVKNTKDWNLVATSYLKSQKLNDNKIGKVLKILAALYS